MKDEREIYRCKIGMVAMYGKGGAVAFFFAGHGYLMGRGNDDFLRRLYTLHAERDLDGECLCQEGFGLRRVV